MPRQNLHVRVVQHRAGVPPAAIDDRVAVEEPLELRIGGRPISITMRTPGHDEDLACGFLVGEGVIRLPTDVIHVRRCDQGEAVDVLPAAGVLEDPQSLARQTYVSSSCGICGAASIEAVRRRFPALRPGPVVQAATLLELPDRLRAAQPTFDATGGLHAAGLFSATGELLIAREDVGRHNAVDKVIGAAFRAGLLPLRSHVLLVSGRASFEIVQKAAAAGIPIVAAVSAPSSLAVDLAAECGMTLAGFLRPGRFNLYSHPDRIEPGPGLTPARG